MAKMFSFNDSNAARIHQDTQELMCFGRWCWKDGIPGSLCIPCSQPTSISTVQQGKKAASSHYSRGGAKYEGEAVKRSLVESYTHPNSNETERRENIDTVMNCFSTEDFDFVTLYYREPDNVGHRFGPEAEKRKLMIQQIGRTIVYLVGATEKHSLQSTSASSSHQTMG
eukprot:XP_011518832.1 ectonucleotide pyrophosphatase/phosphodiesterase family member 7-like [Homo sapiens]